MKMVPNGRDHQNDAEKIPIVCNCLLHHTMTTAVRAVADTQAGYTVLMRVLATGCQQGQIVSTEHLIGYDEHLCA